MRVVEIFDSIDGEGLRAGELATFVRLAGCNLRCSYCDTAYAMSTKSPGCDMEADQIIEKVAAIGNKNVTLTGGEPLLYEEGVELALQLCRDGYSVNVETNGSVDFMPLIHWANCTVTMDYKTPSSGHEHSMRADDILWLRAWDVLKFVCAESDLKAVRDVLVKYRPRCWIYLSPIFGKIEPVRLVEFMKELREEGISTNRMRVQLQLHKFIWPPEQRGV